MVAVLGVKRPYFAKQRTENCAPAFRLVRRITFRCIHPAPEIPRRVASDLRRTGCERDFSFGRRKVVIRAVSKTGECGPQQVSDKAMKLALGEVSSRERLEKRRLQCIEQSGQANPIIGAT